MNYLPLDYIGFAAAVVYAACMLLLCLYAMHSLWLLWRYRHSLSDQRLRQHSEDATALPGELPLVLVQIPVFNERDVVERAMEQAAGLDWPRERLEIQVLDDSTDDCVDISRACAERLRRDGVPIEVLHRSDRTGYKAGALELGMQQSAAEYIAIFDADFLPEADFLKRAIKPFFGNRKLALVQGRWEHCNRNENILCKAQAIGIDGHFAVEQSARAWSGLALNFNGTCGLWRRSAIEDAGGWEHDTLTEDMDLSYRAQLRGWQCTFRSELAVPGEIPNHVDAWRSQQFRWAKGSIQTALKLLPAVWRSDWSWTRKIAASFHMTHYLVHPFILVSLLCAPLALGLCPRIPDSILMLGLGAFLIGIGSPFILYAASQYILHGCTGLKRMRYFPALAAIGTGIAISNTRAVSQALQGIQSAFIRTPKKGDGGGSYAASREHGLFELACAAWAGLGIVWGLHSDRPWILPLLLIYISGFAWVGVLSFRSWYAQIQTQQLHSPRWIYALGACSVGLYTALALQRETWVYAAGTYVTLGLLIAASYLAAVWLIKKAPAVSRRGLACIIICGLLFRLAMLFGMAPSDDVNRYIVEGRQAAYAQNPYVVAPHDPEARALLDGRLDARITDAVNHGEWTAIYPPLTIAIETMVTHIRSTPFGIKVAVLLSEALALLLLCGLLQQRKLAAGFLLLAWWNPVGPIWLSGEGHNDAWMLMFLLLGLWYADRQSEKRSIAALSFAALCKPFAAWALLPSLIRAPWYHWLLPLSIAALAYYPFMDAGMALFNSLGRFGSELHFHGAFEPLLRGGWGLLLSDPDSVRLAVIASLMFILFSGSALLMYRDMRGVAFHGQGDRAALCAKLLALVFLCLPTLYPWYFAPLIFLLPFVRNSWGLIFWTAWTPVFWLHGMAIETNGGVWTETPWVTSLAHLPAIVWLGSDMVMRSRPWQLVHNESAVRSH